MSFGILRTYKCMAEGTRIFRIQIKKSNAYLFCLSKTKQNKNSKEYKNDQLILKNEAFLPKTITLEGYSL